MLVSPDGSEGLRNIEVSKGKRLIGWNVQLNIIARGKSHLFLIIDRLQNEFLYEGSNAAIANYLQMDCFLIASTDASCLNDIEVQASFTFFNRIGGQSTAHRDSRGRSIC